MTLTPEKTETISALEDREKLDWKDCWYPIIFVKDFSNKYPYGFTLYDEPFLIFEDKNSKLACLRDICPHRAAKLSDGQIIAGKIECLYHGWQFDITGKCQHIPQLPDEATIPHNACVESFAVIKKQGMIWFWRGQKELAKVNLIPTISKLDTAEFAATDFAIDLPYDQSYLIENALDPAHVHISHAGGLGDRKKAQPLVMEILESSIKGIQGKYQYSQQANDNWIELDFTAPNLVTYGFNISKNITIGTALYSIPTGKGHCRLLLRNYSNFWILNKLKPRWLAHLESNRILEEDSAFIVAQQSLIESGDRSMQKTFLPLKTSDVLVLEYRKWLDKYGKSLPFYQGYTTSKIAPEKIDRKPDKATLDRFKQHTQICRTCSKTYQTTIRLKQILISIAIALAAIAIVTETSNTQILLITLSILSVILVAIAEQFKTKFERSYTRH